MGKCLISDKGHASFFPILSLFFAITRQNAQMQANLSFPENDRIIVDIKKAAGPFNTISKQLVISQPQFNRCFKQIPNLNS